jgi:hypothetical protein
MRSKAERQALDIQKSESAAEFLDGMACKQTTTCKKAASFSERVTRQPAGTISA